MIQVILVRNPNGSFLLKILTHKEVRASPSKETWWAKSSNTSYSGLKSDFLQIWFYETKLIIQKTLWSLVQLLQWTGVSKKRVTQDFGKCSLRHRLSNLINFLTHAHFALRTFEWISPPEKFFFIPTNQLPQKSSGSDCVHGTAGFQCGRFKQILCWYNSTCTFLNSTRATEEHRRTAEISGYFEQRKTHLDHGLSLRTNKEGL